MIYLEMNCSLYRTLMCRHGGEVLWSEKDWVHIRKKRRARKRSHQRNRKENIIFTTFYLRNNKLRVPICTFKIYKINADKALMTLIIRAASIL